jgi:phytoene dehydrogenase-like protein
VRRLRARGGTVRCGAPVERILVRRRSATGVRLAGGEELGARRAVIADTSAPALYERLLPTEAVPARVRHAVRRLQLDFATVKVDWALDAPIPWANPAAAAAGTVHVSEGLDGLTRATAEIAMGRKLERAAPGFGATVLARAVSGPGELEGSDANLLGGALNNGSAQLHQELVLRPVPGLGRPETPVGRLYLDSAAAHPGGGVHGGPGHNAARTALRRDRLRTGGLRPGAWVD